MKNQQGKAKSRTSRKHPRRPRNLREALDQGWKLVAQDLSFWGIGDDVKREGFLVFNKPGCRGERLHIPFTALYAFRTPYFFPRDVQ